MEFKKRDASEEICVSDLYIGMKVDNTNTEYGLSIGLTTFTIVQKLDYQIGLLGGEPLSIYEDLEEEKYSYVNAMGKVLVPSEQVKYTPSLHLAYLTKLKSLREIIEACLEKLKTIPDVNEKVLASYQKIVDTFKEADSQGKFAKVNLKQMQEQFKQNIEMYIFAFGNPLDNAMDERAARPMTDEELRERDSSEEKRKF